jgi:hypothetical protein
MSTKDGHVKVEPRGGVLVRLHERLKARANGEDGFALVFSLLLIMIIAAVSIGVAGLIYSQTQPTQFARKNVRTVNAASAGTQVVLDKLRAANDGAGNGKLTLIPCAGATGAQFKFGPTTANVPGATYTGAVSNNPGSLTYNSSVAYLTQDPAAYEPGGTAGNTTYAQFLTWLQSNALSCPLSAVPSYAFIQSTGLGAAVPGLQASQGNRSQHSIYQFATINTNIVGGRIIELNSNPAMCIQARTASPNPGDGIDVAPCQAFGTQTQMFQYRNDLTIYYSGDTTKNLCIQKPSSGNTPTFQTCVTDGTSSTYPYASGQQVQEWGFNDSGHFAAALSDGTVTNGSGGTCLDPSGATSTSQPTTTVALVTVSCDGVTFGYTAWNPDPQVGAGKAGGNTTGLPGTPTQQYVNYQEFGRCLDVTGQNVNADHLIDYPCKQAPNSGTLTWNQLWTWTAVSSGYGKFYTTYSGTQYCLTAPASPSIYITTTPCGGSVPNNQLWRPTGNTGSYTTSYLLQSKSYVDSSGNPECMAASTLPSGDLTTGSSNIVVLPCSGSLAQKWNAPANAPATGLGDLEEDSGSEG